MKTRIELTLDIEHDIDFPIWEIPHDYDLAHSVARHVKLHLRASTLRDCNVVHVKPFAGESYVDDPASEMLPIYIKTEYN